MMEEAATPTRGQKERFISQIVTPHHPTYLYGGVDKKGVTAQDTTESRPIVGVACSVSGFKVKPMTRLGIISLVLVTLNKLPEGFKISGDGVFAEVHLSVHLT